MVEASRDNYFIRLAEKTFGIDRYREVQQEVLRHSQKPQVLDRALGVSQMLGQFFLPTTFRDYQRRREHDHLRGWSNTVLYTSFPLTADAVTNYLSVSTGLITAFITKRPEVGVGTYFLCRAVINVMTHVGFDLLKTAEEVRPQITP